MSFGCLCYLFLTYPRHLLWLIIIIRGGRTPILTQKIGTDQFFWFVFQSHMNLHDKVTISVKPKHAAGTNCRSLCAFAVFYLVLLFSTTNQKCFDTFASLWFAATTRNRSAKRRMKKAQTATKDGRSPSIPLDITSPC